MLNHHLAEILQVNLAQQLNEVHEKYRIGDLELTVSDHVANGSFKSLKENVELVEKPDYALFLRNVDLKNKLNGDRRYVTESSYEFLKNLVYMAMRLLSQTWQMLVQSIVLLK